MTESAAERVAKAAGWKMYTAETCRLRPWLKVAGFSEQALVPVYFYHADADILDTDSQSWEGLCNSQPRLSAALDHMEEPGEK